MQQLSGGEAARGLGWFDDEKEDALPLEEFGAFGEARSPRMLPHSRVRDQAATNSCVGQALALATEICLEMRGERPPELSPFWIYARARDEHDSLERDDGTYIHLAVRQVEKFGVCPLTAWQPKPGQSMQRFLKRKPGITAQKAAHDLARITSLYRIAGNRAAGVKRAIDRGHAVVFGTHVDEAFLRDTGPFVVGPPKGNVGGHAMVITGWRSTPTGDQYHVVNSWGEGWRLNGTFWLTQEWLEWPFLSNLTVVTA